MSLRKQRSRKIKVAEINFRWTIAPKDSQIILAAESIETKGRKIEVTIDSDINRMWVEFPYTENLNLRVFKPNDVENIISLALQKGWGSFRKRQSVTIQTGR